LLSHIHHHSPSLSTGQSGTLGLCRKRKDNRRSGGLQHQTSTTLGHTGILSFRLMGSTAALCAGEHRAIPKDGLYRHGWLNKTLVPRLARTCVDGLWMVVVEAISITPNLPAYYSAPLHARTYSCTIWTHRL